LLAENKSVVYPLEVEPQTAAAAAEPHGAEFSRVRVDPAAVHSQLLGDRGRVCKSCQSRPALHFGQDLGDSRRDQLDVMGVQLGWTVGGVKGMGSTVTVGRHNLCRVPRPLSP
jgi:hypothetical protein